MTCYYIIFIKYVNGEKDDPALTPPCGWGCPIHQRTKQSAQGRAWSVSLSWLPEIIIQAAHHADSQSGWSFRFATLLAHASRVTEHRPPLSSPGKRALNRLETAQLEAIHGCCKGNSLPLNIRTAHRRRDCWTVI